MHPKSRPCAKALRHNKIHQVFWRMVYLSPRYNPDISPNLEYEPPRLAASHIAPVSAPIVRTLDGLVWRHSLFLPVASTLTVLNQSPDFSTAPNTNVLSLNGVRPAVFVPSYVTKVSDVTHAPVKHSKRMSPCSLLTYRFTHSLARSLAHSLTHSLIHSLARSLTPSRGGGGGGGGGRG